MLFQAQVLKTEKYKLDLLFSIQAVGTKKQKTFIAYAAVQKILAHTLLKIKVPQGDF